MGDDRAKPRPPDADTATDEVGCGESTGASDNADGPPPTGVTALVEDELPAAPNGSVNDLEAGNEQEDGDGTVGSDELADAESPSDGAEPPETQGDSPNPAPRAWRGLSLRTRVAAWKERRRKRREDRTERRGFLRRLLQRSGAPRVRTNFKRELYSIPNILTYIRIATIPVILLAIQRDTRWHGLAAGILFALASVTDFLDGYLARKLNQVTVLGKLLDPLADKLVVASALILMIPLGRVPAWMVILILARELVITALRGIASSEGLVMSASRIAKYKTAFQLVAIGFLLVHYRYVIDFGFVSFPVNFHVVGILLLGISLAYSLISAADYLVKFAEAINRGQDESS